MRIGLALLSVLTLVAAFPAAANWALSPAVVTRLEAGEVHAEVGPAPAPAAGVVHGAVDIAAPPEVVWDTILDCHRAGRMAPGVRSCRVVERDPAGRWDVREMTVRWAVVAPTFRTVFRSEFAPGRIRFRCVSGDIRYCSGEWRLEPIGQGRTRVLYENRASSPISAPVVVSRAGMRGEVARALKALKREAESRAP